jgi:lipopolysaccharide/colanic/teichoic acid biosynthesis glycosyltransferase
MMERLSTSLAEPLRRDPAKRGFGCFASLFKRTFDLLFAVVGLILFAPLFLLIALLIKLDSPGPVFFRHLRVGRCRRLFWMWKFRKMHDNLAQPWPRLTRRYDARLTRMGQILERTKLDELPQLFNVLVGDMSVIGPRPEVPKFVEEHYEEEWDKVLTVKPGLIGPCQLRFRNESELYPDECRDMEAYYVAHILPAKLAIDAEYASRYRLFSDAMILVCGVFVAVFGAVTLKTLVNRRWQVLNFVVLSLLGVALTAAVTRVTRQPLGTDTSWYLVALSFLVKPLCLLLFKIPKAVASSLSADDVLRCFWCAATSGAMIGCFMLYADYRDVGRLPLMLDMFAFATVLVVYKLTCYNAYMCFVLHQSRGLSRRLFFGSVALGPLSMFTVVTLRHGFGAWVGENGTSYLILLLLCLLIRPSILLLKPISLASDTTSWLLKEWKKLFFESLIGSFLIVFTAVMLNERGVSRLDTIYDGALYLSLMTCFAVCQNRLHGRASNRTPSHSVKEVGEKEKLLVVGSGIELSAYISVLSALPEHHFEIVGVVTHQGGNRTNTVGGFPILGDVTDAPEIVRALGVTTVVVVGRKIRKAVREELRDRVVRVELLGPVLRRWRRDGPGKSIGPSHVRIGMSNEAVGIPPTTSE